MGEFAVFFELRNAEVNRALTGIRHAFGSELLNQICHFRNVFSGTNNTLWLFKTQSPAIFEKRLFVGLGVFLNCLFRGDSAADDFVFHVGDVHHVI